MVGAPGEERAGGATLRPAVWPSLRRRSSPAGGLSDHTGLTRMPSGVAPVGDRVGVGRASGGGTPDRAFPARGLRRGSGVAPPGRETGVGLPTPRFYSPSVWVSRGVAYHTLPHPHTGCFRLPGQDSNLDTQIQSLLCYPYTTRQSHFIHYTTPHPRRRSPAPLLSPATSVPIGRRPPVAGHPKRQSATGAAVRVSPPGLTPRRRSPRQTRSFMATADQKSGEP